MKLLPLLRGLAALALSAAAILPAQSAEIITFEGADPALFSGSAVTVGDYQFASDGFGFSGIDNATAFSIFGNAPANAQGQFLFMLNNDGMTMSRTDGAGFRLVGTDTAFIPPVGGLGPNLLAGELLAIAQLVGGGFASDRFVFSASDANGDFNFSSWNLGSLFGQAVTAVGFFACIYQADTSCSFTAQDVPAQFALDNIRVPEPGAASLVLLALGLAALSRRRRGV